MRGCFGGDGQPFTLRVTNHRHALRGRNMLDMIPTTSLTADGQVACDRFGLRELRSKRMLADDHIEIISTTHRFLQNFLVRQISSVISKKRRTRFSQPL